MSSQCNSCSDPCLLDGSAFTEFLATLNMEGFAGHHDWRLPSSAGIAAGQGFICETMASSEIESLVDTTGSACETSPNPPCIDAIFNTNCGPADCGGDVPCGNPGCTIDGAGGTQECSCTRDWYYWSGSLSPESQSCPFCGGGTFAQGFNFEQHSLVGPASTSDLPVRAVRGTNCIATTCAGQAANCGTISDGCGGTLDCGTCMDPQVCGTNFVTNNQCCTPTSSCATWPAECGIIGDGCGHAIDCGTCTLPETCGGGGQYYQCGCTDNGHACDDQVCGTALNNCGDSVLCGVCPTDRPRCCHETCVCSTCSCP